MKTLKPHKARKRFGQNFLNNTAIIHTIIDAIAINKTDHLVEIGPGQGALTRPILQLVDAMDAIELDRDLIPILEIMPDASKLTIHQSDAMKFDFCALAEQRKLRVIGNLPYNISTPILFHILDQVSCIQDMHFMLQKEVVDRMAATPGNKTYGRLSVILQWQCNVTPLLDIPPHAFDPAPKVDSAFVRLTPLDQPRYEVGDQKVFKQLVTMAFSQRRKTIRNNLKKIISDELLAEANILATERAEQLSIEQFAQLSRLYSAQQA